MKHPRSLMLACAVSSLMALVPGIVVAKPLVLAIEPEGSQQQPRLAGILESAYRALSQGELDSAERMFNEARSVDPEAAGPYIGLAEVALHRQQWALTEARLKEAMDAEPDNYAAVRALGRYQFLQGDFASAESTFKRALALNALEPRLHVDLGDTRLRLNKPVAAEAAYREAIRLRDNHVIAHMGLAAALAAQGKIAPAIAEYELAARVEPPSPLPLHLLGRLYASQGRFREAIKVLDRALQTDRSYVPAYIERGDVRFAAGEYPAALFDYQRAASLAGEQGQQRERALALFNTGVVYQAQEKWEQAKKAYLAAIEADPKLVNAYNNLAWMAADRGEDLDEGLRWIEKAIEISPGSTNSYDTLGWVYLARGERDLAIDAFETAAAADSPQPGVLYRLGLAYAEAGRAEEASTALRRALAISAEFPEAARARSLLDELD